MSMTRDALKPPQAVATIHELTLTRDPQKALAEASKAAKALQEVVKKAGLLQNIGGRNHLRVEAWQTLGAFYGVTADVEWTKPIAGSTPTIIVGFEARATALWHGQKISAAEAECRTDEKNWQGKPLFQLRAMAQTRATARALRHVLAWLVVMAGYEATPAEEMTMPPAISNPDPLGPTQPAMPVTDRGVARVDVHEMRAESSVRERCADYMTH